MYLSLPISIDFCAFRNFLNFKKHRIGINCIFDFFFLLDLHIIDSIKSVEAYSGAFPESINVPSSSTTSLPASNDTGKPSSSFGKTSDHLMFYEYYVSNIMKRSGLSFSYNQNKFFDDEDEEDGDVEEDDGDVDEDEDEDDCDDEENLDDDVEAEGEDQFERKEGFDTLIKWVC